MNRRDDEHECRPLGGCCGGPAKHKPMSARELPQASDVTDDDSVDLDADPCPECGKDVADDLPICPHCGYAIIRRHNVSPAILIVGAVLVAALLILALR